LTSTYCADKINGFTNPAIAGSVDEIVNLKPDFDEHVLRNKNMIFSLTPQAGSAEKIANWKLSFEKH
jgi:hypothetical protein